jgi:hypothetical protein
MGEASRSRCKATPGLEYEAPFSNILVENTRVENTGASGIFVDGYVSGVTLRQLDVTGAGSVGIYLEAGSKDNVITRTTATAVLPGSLPSASPVCARVRDLALPNRPPEAIGRTNLGG